MPHPSIAIIGAGFSGATLALQLLASGKGPKPHIHLIDRAVRFGPGGAYATSYPGHLMNVHAANLSARPDKPDDFVDWLSARIGHEAPPSRFAERAAYGEYLEVQLRRAAHASDALHFVRDMAVAIETDKAGVEVVLHSGRTLRVDAAVLATGNQPAAAPPAFSSPDVAPYLINPWDADLGRIRPDADVLLLGAGLTMVDAMLRLSATPRTGRVIALSRHAILPRRHTQSQRQHDEPFWVEGRLSEMLRQFRAEIAATMARRAPWQSVFERLRPQSIDIWMSLPLEAKRRFLRHLRPYWDAHRHLTPPHVHAWISALQDTGTLKVIAGRVTHATRTDRGFDIAYRPRGARKTAHLRVAHIVNCTGPCADLTQSPDPLLQQILQDGVARPHATGLGLDVEVNGRLIGASGVTQSRIFALGPLAQGAFWETTAVPEIRANAAAMAKHLHAAARRPYEVVECDGVVAFARARRNAVGDLAGLQP